MTRRHDIDALRALAFALLILYHLGMFYVADWDWHVKSVHLAEWLQWPMLFVNRWRMDLVFLVSGMASAFLLKPGGILAFLWSRHNRLVLPLVFGILVVVPIQPYAQGVSNHLVQPGFWNFLLDYYSGRQWPENAFSGWKTGFTWNHLWYLAYLWMYTLALALLARPLASRIGRAITSRFTGLRGWALVVVPALPLFAFTVLLQARFPDNGDFIHDWYRNAMYFTAFLYGFLVAKDAGFWAEALRLRRATLVIALAAGFSYLGLVALLPDGIGAGLQDAVWALRNLYVWTMLLAILGWAHALLNRPSRWLPWANASVYPWYMLHQSLIVGLGFFLADWGLGPVVEPLLILAGTVFGCWAITEVVKQVGWLRPLFGIKRDRSTPRVLDHSPGHVQSELVGPIRPATSSAARSIAGSPRARAIDGR
jgi:peptidoglycan/LPS O-acetylase OafA/YrhL